MTVDEARSSVRQGAPPLLVVHLLLLLLKHLIVLHLLAVEHLLIVDHVLQIVLVALPLDPVVVRGIVDRRAIVLVARVARLHRGWIGNA